MIRQALWRSLPGIVALALGGCATLSTAASGGTAKSEAIADRVTALEGLVSTLGACSAKGKPEDHGVFAVSAKPSGELSIDAAEWSGSQEMRACVEAQAKSTRLPAWSGGTLGALWTVGTKDHPAPGPLADDPPRFRSELQDQTSRTQGTPELGPLLSCAQRNLPNDAYAKVQYRIFVFPEGKVAAVSPISVDGEGRDAGFQDCLRDLIKAWTFTPFSGPGYVAVQVTFKKGLDETFK